MGLKSFVRNHSGVHIHLLMDHTVAIAYLNRLGGTRSYPLCQLATGTGVYREGSQFMQIIYGQNECESRFCFQKLERLQRLDAGPSDIYATTEEVRPFLDRSVRILSKCSDSTVLQLEAKSKCTSSGCFSSALEPF